jgi:hypothetical protein
MGIRIRNISNVAVASTAATAVAPSYLDVPIDGRMTFGYARGREFAEERIFEYLKTSGILPRGTRKVEIVAVIDDRAPDEKDRTGSLSAYYELRNKVGSSVQIKGGYAPGGKLTFDYHARGNKRLSTNVGDQLRIEPGNDFDSISGTYGLDGSKRLVSVDSVEALFVDDPEDFGHLGVATPANTYLKLEMHNFELDDKEWELGYWEHYGDGDYDEARKRAEDELFEDSLPWRDALDGKSGEWSFTREQVESMVESVNFGRGSRNKLYAKSSGLTPGQYLDTLRDSELVPLAQEYLSRGSKLHFYGSGGKVLERK